MCRLTLMIAVVFVAACQTTEPKVPVGKTDFQVHADYAKWRPVTIAVLPVKSNSHEVRADLRKEIYTGLIKKRYTPFRLDVVDAHIDSNGKFSAGSLDWDATFEVTVTEWRVVRGTQKYAASGTAQLTHKSGEVLWTMTFTQETFDAESRAAQTDTTDALKALARHILDKERFPDLPPLKD